MIIEHDECAVCEKCVPVCPKGLIQRVAFKMVVHDGCDHCGTCLESCPVGAIFLEDE